ncbi:MAG TPA: cobalamin-binding protein [Myxococcota bacterium]|nr:cobalamin-binding protein [Myxococcota bacterium]
MERIVSLLPSLTETACALGLRGRLVGRSHECDHPPGVEALPVLTAPRGPLDGSSAAIDARVRELVQSGLSVYEVDAEALRALAPDLVLTQDQCAVCAASLADVESALAAWTGRAPRVLSVAPSTLRDVWGSLRAVADAAGVPERGAALVASLNERVANLGERTGALPRPRIACLEWLDPLMDAGHWMPELVAIAGGRAALGASGARSRTISLDALAASDPDVILAAPCGFDLPRTRAELPALLAQPAFRSLRAVREGRLYAADGNAFFNRPGPRLVESLEILAEVLHPDGFDFGHAGRAFERVTG